MKTGNTLSVILAVAVASVLLVAAAAEWPGLGPTERLRSAHAAFRIAGYCIGAVGAICLGGSRLALSRRIASMARRLRSDDSWDRDASQEPVLRDLWEAIHARLAGCSRDHNALQAQCEDARLQARLARRREANIEAILHSLRDGVIVVDGQDRLQVANAAAGTVLGFDHRAGSRRPLAELVDRNGSALLDLLVRTRRSGAQANRSELEFEVDGAVRTFDCVVSCVTDGPGASGEAVAVLHDVTREKEISRMKNDFVSHVSHELKTPLASISAYAEMLVDGEANDEATRAEFYAVIQKQAGRLNRLIEDILNISRIESGLVKIHKSPVSPTILIAEQLEMLGGYAEEKGVTLTGQHPIVHDQVYADRDMLSQVIVNLLSNAIKYTPAGGSVRVETEVDESARVVKVRVIDTGVGIPAEDVDHVFDKFYRVDANKKQAKGTGLGLNLVKQIVETAHTGRVFVTSEAGVGSTFGFELPLATRELVETA